MENERLTMLVLLKEIGEILGKFFKPCGIKDEILSIPSFLWKSGIKKEALGLGMTCMSLAFSFLLLATNAAIEAKFIFLGIMLFMLYRGQQVIRDSYTLYVDTENEKNRLNRHNELTLRGGEIIGRVSNRVLKFNETTGVWKIIPDEDVINCVKKYLDGLWELKIKRFFEYCEILSVVIMLIVAVLTNKAIPQHIFIPIIVFFSFASFLGASYVSISGKRYYAKNREYDNRQSVILNDILRVPEIAVGHDIKMRLERFRKTNLESNQNNILYAQKRNKNYLLMSSLETISQYGLIIFYLMGVEWNSVYLATIAEITATLIVAENALGYISRIFRSISYHAETVNGIEKETEDMKKILAVYHSEEEKNRNSQKITQIVTGNFSISYLEESENDKPFTLVSKEKIEIGEGEIAILYGPSGSGKSTFMNVITQRIFLTKAESLPATSRFMMYDEKLKFGSLTIFEELFCCTEEPNLDKMKTILENLHLWQEIQANCHDVWQWMKEKYFNHSLSNGQKQRIILAKMLYWKDEKIDVVVLDEATSGLDDTSDEKNSANASEILEYVVREANSDRKRITVIATHQDIEPFIQKMSKDYKIRIFEFEKKGEQNLIKQIQ